MNSSLLPLMLFWLGLAAILGLFLKLQSEMKAQARFNDQRYETVLAQLRNLEPAAPEANPTSGMPASGMNLSKRSQAVRLLRRGEDVGHIAAALGLPRGEVELLIRVQQMSVRRTDQSGGS